MPVHRPKIRKAELFEQNAVDQRVFQGVSHFCQPVHHAVADSGDLLKSPLELVLKAVVAFGNAQFAEVVFKAARALPDRHFIIVEDDDGLCLGIAQVVQRLVSKTAGHGAVADDGNRLVVFALQVSGGAKAGKE